MAKPVDGSKHTRLARAPLRVHKLARFMRYHEDGHQQPHYLMGRAPQATWEGGRRMPQPRRSRLLAQSVQQQLWCGSSCDAGDRGMDACRRSVGVFCSKTPFLHQCLAQLSFHEATRSCQAAMRRFCNRPL